MLTTYKVRTKPAVTALFLLLGAFCAPPHGFVRAAGEKPPGELKIDSVRVTARRTMSEIGAQKTAIGEEILHESVTTSVADIIAQNTPVFVKSYGRATLSTVSTRGTSPSHTQVTWNGMKINSPMLGMVDFSYIPSIFIDNAAVYYGASSTGITGGGLGGAVTLATRPQTGRGAGIAYTQGIGSFRTFDQFLKLAYGGSRWGATTRAAYTTSANDFPYTNYYKKDFIRDDRGNITGFGYPVERNRNCSYDDLNIMQEFSFDAGHAGKLGATVWWMDSSRGIPLLNVDYREESEARARQDEQTLRAILSWDRASGGLKLGARTGYLYSDLLYLLRLDYGNGQGTDRVRSQSYVQTVFGRLDAEYTAGDRWMFAANLSLHQNFVRTYDDAYVPVSPEDPSGYDVARTEVSGFVSARWKVTERFGAALNLRSEVSGKLWAPVIPGLFLDYLLSEKDNVVLKASVARNYRFPTFNDLYFKSPSEGYAPRDLRPERGLTYDAGIEFASRRGKTALTGALTLFDSHITDWILWRPSGDGASYSAVNIRAVHSYGAELRAFAETPFGNVWKLSLDGKLGYTRSVNRGEPLGEYDNSVGRQLPYIPVWSSAATGRLSRGGWTFAWRWRWYSERYTSTDNSGLITGRVLPYIMNDVSLGRSFDFRRASLSLRLDVNNLFNEEYESELARPMPRRNYGFFITLTPKWGKRLF